MSGPAPGPATPLPAPLHLRLARRGRWRAPGRSRIGAASRRRERPAPSALERFALRAADEARSRRAEVLEVSAVGDPGHGDLFGPGYHAVEVAPPVAGAGLVPPPRLPVPPGRYGVVLCTGVVPRSLEPRVVLSELSRVLRPDGTVYVSTTLVVPDSPEPSVLRPPGGPRFGLNYLMEAAGFRIAAVTPLSEARQYGVVAAKRNRGHRMDTPGWPPIR